MIHDTYKSSCIMMYQKLTRMSVSKKTSAILREEEEESSRLGACSRDYVDSETDCSICRKTFVVTINEKGEGSNKCPECLKKILINVSFISDKRMILTLS